MPHMSMERQPDRRRRRAQATNGLIASGAKSKGSPWQRDDDSQGGEIQDIWCHIHSLMPMRAAARAACVSRAFLRSWRCHPNLTFSSTTFGLDKKAYENDDTARDSSRVDQILKKHSGIGVKKLKIHMFQDCSAEDSSNLDSWLQIAVTPGIEELTLTLPMQALPMQAKFNFPYSPLCNGSGNSIRNLFLAGCSFNPISELGWLISLRKLYLHDVCITGDELGCLLCNSFALERLLRWDFLLEGPLHAAAAQIPRDFWLCRDANDRQQSSKYIQLLLRRRSQSSTVTRRNIANGEARHNLLWRSSLHSC